VDSQTRVRVSIQDEPFSTLHTQHWLTKFFFFFEFLPREAVQILNSFNIPFHTVDVLSDENIRQGVKAFSQWPTIPQLYVAGEFIGGSDIMIELYQSGELGEMIEKAKADMM
jgi:Grx4 family monothiol glutaredoxin